MIASYTTLLQRRYAGRLDDDADTFISFIVDGVAPHECVDSGPARILSRGQQAETTS